MMIRMMGSRSVHQCAFDCVHVATTRFYHGETERISTVYVTSMYIIVTGLYSTSLG